MWIFRALFDRHDSVAPAPAHKRGGKQRKAAPPKVATLVRPGEPIVPRMYAVDRTVLQRVGAGTGAAYANASLLLASLFVATSRDNVTDAFLAEAARAGRDATARSKRLQQRREYLAAQQTGMSRTDAFTLFLGEQTTLVASTNQFAGLLAPAQPTVDATSLLDIGAGPGCVTASLATALRLPPSRVTAMETSAPLRKALSRRGYRACNGFESLESASPSSALFSVVSMLNVLDRCDDPRALLSRAVSALPVNGILVVATVVPYCDHIYEGKRGHVDAHRPPARPLTIPSAAKCGKRPPAFEEAAAAFASTAFAGLPLRLASWTRVPYLCSGNHARTHFVLDNAIFVLRRTIGIAPAK